MSTMHQVFWKVDEQGRTRARVWYVLVMWFSTCVLASMLAEAGVMWSSGKAMTSLEPFLAVALAKSVLTGLLTHVALGELCSGERTITAWSELLLLGTTGVLRSCVTGLGLCIVIVCPVVLQFVLVGTHWELTDEPCGVGLRVGYLMGWFLVALHEEMLFRSLFVTQLPSLLGYVGACSVSSFLFTLPHAISNPHPTTLLSLLGLGLLLHQLTKTTRSLWGSVTFHFLFNVMQTSFFGLPISGHSFPCSILTPTGRTIPHLEGSPWLLVIVVFLNGILFFSAHRSGIPIPSPSVFRTMH
mmetsp:Transcript_13253/g.37676  ORF Transcript_13253/g.37676 Transcript_13253/m.37676 type:complete len:299 (+) Transcript_13253:133-1029(+)